MRTKPEADSNARASVLCSHSIMRYPLRIFGLCTVMVAACSDDTGNNPSGAEVKCNPVAQGPIADPLSKGRLLRRAALALSDAPPAPEDYAAMEAAQTDADRERVFQTYVESLLVKPAFYRSMVDFGHAWFRNGDLGRAAKGEEIWLSDHRIGLYTCPDASKHKGALYAPYNYAEATAPVHGPTDGACNDLDYRGVVGTPIVNTVEPWWAPGTTVTMVGRGGTGVRTDPSLKDPDCGITNPIGYDSEFRIEPGNAASGHVCSCGPNLRWCKMYTRYEQYRNDANVKWEEAPNRQGWDEPARLLGHLAWQDRSLTDLVLGNYSVGPAKLQGWYVSIARKLSTYASLDGDDSWWKPSMFKGPVDPEHELSDPLAWREFVVETRNPMLLSLTGNTPSGDINRTYTFDPRTSTGTIKGIPAAGVLTMAGVNAGFSRERVRAARWLENFACREFVPPPVGATFNTFVRDPGREGTCQYCHTAIDPAAIHFKRISDNGYTPIFLGLGPWGYEKLRDYEYPRTRLDVDFKHDTLMTPASEAQIKANPDAANIDFLPPDTTLFGQVSEGTVGPLGFGKLLVKSGEFDQCVARKMFEHVVGRKLDPAVEQQYIEVLGKSFVENKRTVRGFVRYLVSTREFRRGL
jgi:hypothetical protein